MFIGGREGRLRTQSGHSIRYLQQGACCWMGGHGAEPYEQKTQQSPRLGLNTAAQPAHS